VSAAGKTEFATVRVSEQIMFKSMKNFAADESKIGNTLK
jgi:hypothetical protein